MDNPRILLARLLMLGAIVDGVIGTIVGITDKTWKLGVEGWLTGGVLLAVISLVVLADEYFATRGQRGEG